MTKPKMSARAAAADVLAKASGPMHIRDIAERVLHDYRTGLRGKTPMATLAAQLYVAASRGETFKRVDKGVFDLIDRPKKQRKPATTPRRVTQRGSRTVKRAALAA